MRWWVALVMLAACDRLFDARSVTVIDANDGAPSDGPFDGQPVPHCVPGTTWASVTGLGLGDSYTVDEAHALAVWRRSSDGVIVSSSNVDQNVGGIQILNSSGLYRPRLSPEGEELFLRDDNTARLAVSSFSMGVWLPQQQLVTIGLSVDPQVLPGTPMALEYGLRHMLVNNTASGTLYELVEKAPRAWTASPFTLGTITPLTSMNLLPDGTVMVFSRMDPSSGLFQIMQAQRATTADAWQAPTPLVTTGVTLADDPFVSAACDHLYYSANTSMFVLGP